MPAPTAQLREKHGHATSFQAVPSLILAETQGTLRLNKNMKAPLRAWRPGESIGI